MHSPTPDYEDIDTLHKTLLHWLDFHWPVATYVIKFAKRGLIHTPTFRLKGCVSLSLCLTYSFGSRAFLV